jgi:hypothetical protein
MLAVLNFQHCRCPQQITHGITFSCQTTFKCNNLRGSWISRPQPLTANFEHSTFVIIKLLCVQRFSDLNFRHNETHLVEKKTARKWHVSVSVAVEKLGPRNDLNNYTCFGYERLQELIIATSSMLHNYCTLIETRNQNKSAQLPTWKSRSQDAVDKLASISDITLQPPWPTGITTGKKRRRCRAEGTRTFRTSTNCPVKGSI